MSLFTPDAPTGEKTSTRRRRWSARQVGGVMLAASLLAAVGATAIPVPYAIESPGPWWNTLGTNDEFANCSPVATGTSDEPLITIEGATTYPTTGALDLLTVCLTGTPDYAPTWFEVMGAYFDPAQSIIPFEYVYPSDQTQEQRDEENATAMVDSQSDAIAAALTHLGYNVTTGVTVGDVSAGLPADGLLEKGDVIVALDGVPVTTIGSLRDALQEKDLATPVTLTLTRNGETITQTLALTENEGAKVLGIAGSTAYTYPFSVTINLNDVGGPSAGMMFTLGIIDKLTPDDLTGGQKIAGTGTMDADGNVGSIGGIRQKMYTAKAAGATTFLAPTDDCGEVVGFVPAGLRVFAVSTLDEALAVVSAVASGSDAAQAALPMCS